MRKVERLLFFLVIAPFNEGSTIFAKHTIWMLIVALDINAILVMHLKKMTFLLSNGRGTSFSALFWKKMIARLCGMRIA